MSGDGLLDPRRRVANHRQPLLAGRQQDDTASVTHQDGGARVFVVGKELFHRHHLWPKLVHNLYYTIVQGDKAWGEVSCRAPFGALDDAGLADVGTSGAGLDNGVAGDLEAGVDAEEARGRIVAIRRGHASLPGAAVNPRP